MSSGTASPIHLILDRVPDSLINIAPEREAETRKLLDGVTLELTASAHFGFCATAGKVIEVPERGVELLWAASLAIWQRYQAYVRIAGRGQSSVDSASTDCAALLSWSIDNQLSAIRTPWPDSLPRPTGFEPLTPEPRPERVADELTLCAVGWLLHHELAHIARGDSGLVSPADSRIQETRADRAATNWLLEKAPVGLPRTKRTVGIAASTFCLMALELSGPRRSAADRTHPPAAERVCANLLDSSLGPDEPAHVVAAISLRLLMDHFSLPAPVANCITAQDCVAEYCAALNAYQRNR